MKWFVGTYSKRNSDGIYLIDFDESNGKFEFINSFGEQSPSNPSFLATDIDNKYLYIDMNTLLTILILILSPKNSYLSDILTIIDFYA